MTRSPPGRHAAAALDAGDASKTLHAAMAKRFATDTCFGVANDALQLLGGYGYGLGQQFLAHPHHCALAIRKGSVS